jgi:DNA-binding MarR family transcriptional regulator
MVIAVSSRLVVALKKGEIDDNVNDLLFPAGGLCWQRFWMAQTPKRADLLQTDIEPVDAALAPITAMMSSRLMVLANLLKRGAILRYKRLAGLSSVEFGLVASLGRRPPMSVVRLAEAVGQDKGQISRALAGLVSRKLVARAVNPKDNREVLVSLTRSGLAAHDAVVAGALERNQRLLEQLDPVEVAMLFAHIDSLTRKAEAMLAVEKELG